MFFFRTKAKVDNLKEENGKHFSTMKYKILSFFGFFVIGMLFLIGVGSIFILAYESQINPKPSVEWEWDFQPKKR